MLHLAQPRIYKYTGDETIINFAAESYIRNAY